MVRNERFSEKYQQKIEGLLGALYPYLQKYKEVPFETKQLNMSLAHFLKVCKAMMCCKSCIIELYLCNNLHFDSSLRNV